MDYQAVNKQLWNDKVAHHLQSEFYGMDAFIAGENTLKSIELELLGDVKGKRILHLQCHFGQDTLSLARMGAKVTGADFSENAIETAKRLTTQLQLEATFVCCDLYDLPQHLKGTFDIVYTSYGTIGWLPDLDKWASVINHFLSPKGKFVFVEFHPIVWMFDNDFETVTYTYHKSEPIVEETTGTYADKNAPISNQAISWNHGLAEVQTALLKTGMNLESFKEYNYSPYSCFDHLIEMEPGKFQIKQFGDKIPMVYSLVFNK